MAEIMDDSYFNWLTGILAIIAIVVSLYGVFSKKPRIFFKIVPVYNDDIVDFNINITNCGDKPAFDINITVDDKIENYINTYNEQELIDIEERIESLKENIKHNECLFIDYSIEKEDLDNYMKKKEFTKNHLFSCFNYDIKFLSGNETEVRFLGRKSEDKGFLKLDCTINANISFYEELKFGFISNSLFMIILSVVFFSYSFLFNIFCLFGFYSSCFYSIYYYVTMLDNSMFLVSKGKGKWKIDMNNNKIVIQHVYKDKIIIKSKNYPYKAVDNGIEKKLETLCDYVESKNETLFFDSEIYNIWESSLTRTELSIIDEYRLSYVHDYKKYVLLYKRLFREDCDDFINNNIQFKNKYEKLMIIMAKSNLIPSNYKKEIIQINNNYVYKRMSRGE